MSDLFAESRTIARQESWIREHFGDRAADVANYGWAADEAGVATKVYGHGVLETAHDGPHVWTPFKPPV